MPNQTVNYKCPSCNGTMHYDADAGKMKCDFCESTFTAAELEALYAEQQKKADTAAAEADKRAAAGEVSAFEQMGNIAGEGTRTVAESIAEARTASSTVRAGTRRSARACAPSPARAAAPRSWWMRRPA